MINNLTGFLIQKVLAFKRDDQFETLSSVKQKTLRPWALVFSVSRMMSFSLIIPYVITTPYHTVYLAVGPAVVVDEGCRSEPELGTVLAAGEHDAKVVLALSQQLVLLLGRQLGDAAHQQRDLVVFTPGQMNKTKLSYYYIMP